MHKIKQYKNVISIICSLYTSKTPETDIEGNVLLQRAEIA